MPPRNKEYNKTNMNPTTVSIEFPHPLYEANMEERHEYEMSKLAERHAAEVVEATTRREAIKSAKQKLALDGQEQEQEQEHIKMLRRRQIENHELAMYSFDEEVTNSQTIIAQLRRGIFDESLMDEYRTRLYLSDDDSIEILRAFAVRKKEDEIVKAVSTITHLSCLIHETYLGLKDDFLLRRHAKMEMTSRSEVAFARRFHRSEMDGTLELD